MGDTLDVIIIGGSYAGMSAALSLGRSMRNVLVLDNGKPCNSRTPYSHNFLTQDGKTPGEISGISREQVMKYDTVKFRQATAVRISGHPEGFEVETGDGGLLAARKIILASGVKDLCPEIPGFAACWGISVIHCPYCHGYEIRNKATGILCNGEVAFEMAKLVFNLTRNLKVFTNGESGFSEEQRKRFRKNGIYLIEEEIVEIVHTNGYIRKVLLKNGNEAELDALYTEIPFEQNISCEAAGIETTDHGFIAIDRFHQTSREGIFACGDNVTMMRSVANAVAQGSFTAAIVNRELSAERF